MNIRSKSFLEGLTDDVEDLYGKDFLSNRTTNNLYSTPYAPLPRPSPKASVGSKPQKRKKEGTENAASSDEISKNTQLQTRQKKRKRDDSVYDLDDTYNVCESRAHLQLPPPLEPCRPEICPYCGSEHIVEDTRQGEMVCRSCGSVLLEHIVDVTSEWHNYQDDNDPDKSRADNVYDPILGDSTFTSIGKVERGAKRHKKFTGGGKDIKRRHDFATHNLTEKDKFLVAAIKDIEQYEDRMNIHGNAINRAKEIFKIYFDHLKARAEVESRSPMKKGAERDSFICAAVLIGSQYERCIRTLADFSITSGLSKRVLNGAVTALRNVIPPEYLKQRITTRDFAEYFIRSLDCSKEFREQTCQLAENLHKHVDLCGRAPTSIAACALHVMCVITDMPKEVRYPLLEKTDVGRHTITKALQIVTLEAVANLLPPDVDIKVPVEKTSYRAF